MSSPETLARMLLSYYASQSEETQRPMLVNLVPEDQDNEYLTEILTIVYMECNRIFTSGQMGITQERYAQCLDQVFISVGHVIKTEIVERSKVSELIYFAKITGDQVALNPYHPFRIKENIEKLSARDGKSYPIAGSLKQLYSNVDMLPNVLVVHDMEPTGNSVMVVKFQKANIHFDNNGVDDDMESRTMPVITDQMISSAMSALDSVVQQLDANDISSLENTLSRLNLNGLNLNDINIYEQLVENYDSNDSNDSNDEDDSDDCEESDTE